MQDRSLPVITWFCIGLLSPVVLCEIGLWCYGLLSEDDAQPPAGSSDIVAPIERQSQSDVNSGQKTTLPSSLESLDTTTDDYTRSVALRALLSSSDQQHVISLLEQSKEIRPEPQRLTTQIEIFRRFAVKDPVEAMKHTFDITWNSREAIVKAIFLEWATSDVDAAITHAKTLGSADQRTALEAILRIRDDWSDERIQELSLEFGLESLGAKVLAQIQISRAFHDPRSAWNTLVEDTQIDRGQVDSLATILELWVAREGFSVVSEAMESIPHIDYPNGILSPILIPIAQNDPLHAFELISEFSESARNAGAFTIVAVWAETDPAAALDVVSEFEFRPTYIKENLLQNIGLAWVESSPYEALQNLPKYLPIDSLRFTLGDAVQKIVRQSPQEAVDILNELSNGVRNLGGDLVKEWALTDALSALNWISSQEESLQPMLLRNVIPALVETDPDLALRTALNQTIAEGQMGLEYEVIRILAQTDVHRATEMLAQVRDHEDTIKKAYTELGRALVRQNESSAAIEMGADLPESLRNDYFRATINQIYNTDPVELYEVLDLLPERKYQQEAAQYLTRDYGLGGDSHKYFTDEQLEEIQSFQ